MAKKYKKNFLGYYDYTETDFIPCFLTGEKSVDIHHIDASGMGGRGKVDVTNGESIDIDDARNLMALTREAHDYFGDKVDLKPFLRKARKSFEKYRRSWIELNPHCEIMNKYYAKKMGKKEGYRESRRYGRRTNY